MFFVLENSHIIQLQQSGREFYRSHPHTAEKIHTESAYRELDLQCGSPPRYMVDYVNYTLLEEFT